MIQLQGVSPSWLQKHYGRRTRSVPRWNINFWSRQWIMDVLGKTADRYFFH